MEGIKIIAFLFILCGFHFCTVRSNDCELESHVSGKIISTVMSGGQKCWTIPVPPGHLIQLKFINFGLKNPCEKENVRINVTGRHEYQYCRSDDVKNPVTAFANVTVIHFVRYSGVSSVVTIEYKVEKFKCLNREGFFKCNENRCVPQKNICNGVKDCKSGEDELGCGNFGCMKDNSFKCYDNSCVLQEKVCDGVKDCKYGEDELGCDTVQRQNCTLEPYVSGKIFSDGMHKGREKCWKIPIPPGHLIHLKFIHFTLQNPCEEENVRINVSGKHKYQFCRSDEVENALTAFDSVSVIHFRRYAPQGSYVTIEYKVENIECMKNNIFKCDDNSCVSQIKICDGVKDCKNGEDELGCVQTIEGVSEAKQKAVSWLKLKRTTSWGWRENTHRAIVALYLASAANFNGTVPEEELMANRVEFLTAVALLRSFLTNSELSMLVNALLVTCHNPRQFYGINLVKRLKDQVEESENTTHPLAYLTLCNAKEPQLQKATTDLNKILRISSEYPFVKDLQAMAVMALSCEWNRNGLKNDEVHYDTIKLYNKTIQHFKTLQALDGSFGNVHTTALIMQALFSSGQQLSKDWKLNTAINYLMEELNSSSVDFLATYFALPVLNGKSLLDIAYVNCSANPRKHGDDPVSDPGPKKRIQYSLYIGDEKDVVHSISLRVPVNYIASEVMKLAQGKDPKYKFQWKTTSGKMYVYEIANVTNDPEAEKFWLLYVGAANCSETLTHLTKGPDEIIMSDGEHLVFWYKAATFDYGVDE